MSVEAIQPPRTLMEVFNNLPEGTLAQLIENELVMSPAPLYVHQKNLLEISSKLHAFVTQHKLGEVLIAPIDVHFDDRNVLQPDIIFVATDRLELLKEDGLHGAPDLVVELLSPSTAKYDRGPKKDVYERFGVIEYWIIDPSTKAAQCYMLSQGKYVDKGSFQAKIHSNILGSEFAF